VDNGDHEKQDTANKSQQQTPFQGLDSNEQMAVGSPQGGSLRHESRVVQKAGPYILK